jgi:hypothetical protein
MNLILAKIDKLTPLPTSFLLYKTPEQYFKGQKSIGLLVLSY